MFGSKKNEPRFKVAFPTLLERKTATGMQTFKVHVTGYFTPKAGAPAFVAEKIEVDGIRDMNIRSFYADEITVLNEWAVKNVWPNLGKFMVKS